MPDVQPIIIGYNPEFAPFAFEDNGSARGLAIERVSTAFERAGIPFVFSPVKLPEMIATLEVGRVDALAGIASVLERRETLVFSKPVVMTGGAWFKLKGGARLDDSELQKPHVPQWRVVTPATGPLIDPIRKHFPHVKLETCEDYDTAFQYIIDGGADVAALNCHVGRMLCDKVFPDMFVQLNAACLVFPLAVATKTGDPFNLLHRLNVHIPDEWSGENWT